MRRADSAPPRGGPTGPTSRAFDFEDPAIYDGICAGDTIGLFQIESRADPDDPP